MPRQTTNRPSNHLIRVGLQTLKACSAMMPARRASIPTKTTRKRTPRTMNTRRRNVSALITGAGTVASPLRLMTTDTWPVLEMAFHLQSRLFDCLFSPRIILFFLPFIAPALPCLSYLYISQPLSDHNSWHVISLSCLCTYRIFVSNGRPCTSPFVSVFLLSSHCSSINVAYLAHLFHAMDRMQNYH